jgi:hypothetical protein
VSLHTFLVAGVVMSRGRVWGWVWVWIVARVLDVHGGTQ